MRHTATTLWLLVATISFFTGCSGGASGVPETHDSPHSKADSSGTSTSPQPQSSKAEDVSKAARDVYQKLWKSLQTSDSIGLNELESLAAWSERMMFGQWAEAVGIRGDAAGVGHQTAGPVLSDLPIGRADMVARAMEGHGERMRQLDELVGSRAAVGKAGQEAVSAARFFRLHAELLPAVSGFLSEHEAERELEVVLPDAGQARPLTGKPPEIFIDVHKDGRYYVAGKEVTLEELRTLLKQAYVNNPSRCTVVVRADPRCLMVDVTAATEACNQAGIRDLHMTTLDAED